MSWKTDITVKHLKWVGVGQRIKRVRKFKGLTQIDLGIRVGVTGSAVSQWENGQVREIKLGHMLLLAKELNIKSLDWLIYGVGDPHKNYSISGKNSGEKKKRPFLPRLLRRPEVESITGLSRSSIYLMMENGDFPRPVKIGPRAVAWSETVIMDWMEGLEGGEQ